MSTASKRNRNLLLRAASEEIVLRGYAGASMASIAARLGYTKGVFAHHFPYKGAILEELSLASERLIRYCIERSRQKAPEGGIRGLAAFVSALSWATSTDAVADAVIHVLVDGNARASRNSPRPEPWHEAIVAFLDDVQDQEQVAFTRDHSASERAKLVMAGIVGMCLYYHQGTSTRTNTWPAEPVLAVAGIIVPAPHMPS